MPWVMERVVLGVGGARVEGRRAGGTIWLWGEEGRRGSLFFLIGGGEVVIAEAPFVSGVVSPEVEDGEEEIAESVAGGIRAQRSRMKPTAFSRLRV